MSNATELAEVASGPSLWALILMADIVVQAVMLSLALASLWCWAIIFDKSFKLQRLRHKANQFERAFWSGEPLEDLYRKLGKRADHPMALSFATGMEEWREAPKSLEPSVNQALIERVAQVMALTANREIATLERGLSTLATIGSVSPFIGLFGTVWGIMNSFQSIAATKNTTLAVVAPGIAEALFATALGLVAAIPAVVAYNKLSGAVDRYAERLDGFADEFEVVLGRELDARRVA